MATPFNVQPSTSQKTRIPSKSDSPSTLTLTLHQSKTSITYLVFSVLGGRFRLVETLECPVHPLVESPVFVDGDPVEVETFLDVEQGLDGPLQNAGVGHVKGEAFLLEALDGQMH